MTNDEICYLYKSAKNKDEEVFILAELTASDAETIIEVLKDAGIYEDNQIQSCIKCKEMYIEKCRGWICPECRRKKIYAKRKTKIQQR